MNKRYWLLALCLLLIGSLAGAESAAPIRRVSGLQARELMKRHAMLLDVRSRQEFAGKHVETAYNIPLAELAKRLTEIPREHPVVVYCSSGIRSREAVHLLFNAGYDAYHLGAMDNWFRQPKQPPAAER